jgi:hypothetical protein
MGLEIPYLFTMNPATKRGPTSMATSPAFLGYPIGRADGLDRTITGLFAKESSNSGKIKPAVQPSLSSFL